MASALELDPVLTKQQRIAELAKQSPLMGFTSLAHHIDLRWLYEAYLRTRPDGAPGVDGPTIRDYNTDLLGNLRSLLERAKSGRYQAPPGTLDDCPVVSAQPPSTGFGATSDTESEATWSLCLLRNYRQQRRIALLPGRCDSYLAELAVSPYAGPLFLGTGQPVAGALPAPARAGGPLGVPSCSEPMT
jgi:hypothetical protein